MGIVMKIANNILNGKTKLNHEEIVQILGEAKDQLRMLPNVITTPKAKLFYIGGLHGDLKCARKIANKIMHSDYHAVFLGDYVDRGPAQVDTLLHLVALKLQIPERVTLLRGNHESQEVSGRYGFHSEVKQNYSEELYLEFLDFFKVIPIAALSRSGIFACHGGVPEDVYSLNDLSSINRFDVNFPDDRLSQLVWNDPKEMNFEFTFSIRGAIARFFGLVAFQKFMGNLNLRLFIRAHEAFPEGIRTFFDGRLISIFSTSYGGRITPMIARIDSDLTVHAVEI